MTETAKILDPICDMIVDVTEARDQGLSMELDGREYGFCSHGCLVRFAKAPQSYVPKVEAWLASRSQGVDHADGAHHASPAHADELPVIDEGMRKWYVSCRCCLSDAYPKVVDQLDAEKAQASS